jgi:hypothetical protein
MTRSTESTADRIELAHWLLNQHVKVCVPEAVCRYCLKPWPCEDVRGSNTVIARAGQLR